PVPARSVGLPYLDQRVGHGPAAAVEYPAVHDDPFADGLTIVLTGEIGVKRPDVALAERGSRGLGGRVWDFDRGLMRGPEPGRGVRRPVEGRVDPRGVALVGGTHQLSSPRRRRARRTPSSSTVGSSVTAGPGPILSGQPVDARTDSTSTPGWI